MSFLLTDAQLAESRDALAGGEVTAALVEFLQRLVSTVGRSGTVAPVLSPTGRWSPHDFEEITQEWIAYGGLLEGGLVKALDAAMTPRALSRYLERSFRNWLTSRSRKLAEPRLLIRSREILEAGAFVRVIPAKHWLQEWWALADWETRQPYQGSDDRLVAAAFALGDLAIIRHDADHADPVVSNPDLERLLKAVFEEAQALLTLRHVSAILRRRFAFAYDEPPIELDELEQPPARGLNPADEVVSAATAREILGELTRRQVVILNDRFNAGLTLDEIAAKRNVSRGTVDNEVRRAAAVVLERTIDDKNYNGILEMVLEMAFLETDGMDE